MTRIRIKSKFDHVCVHFCVCPAARMCVRGRSNRNINVHVVRVRMWACETEGGQPDG